MQNYKISKFELDLQAIAELEKISAIKEEPGLNFVPLDDAGFSAFIGGPVVQPNAYLSGQYRPVRTKFADLLRTKDASVKLDMYPQWKFAVGKHDSPKTIKAQITEHIVNLFPTKLIIVRVAKLGGQTKTLIFTENDLENTFEFLRGKNWLTKDVSFVHFWSDVTNSYLYAPDVKISLCDADTGNLNYSNENQEDFFKNYALGHVYCMRKILAKYKDLICNDLILRQIDPHYLLPIEQNKPEEKVDLIDNLVDNQGAKWTIAEENNLALEIKTKSLEEIAVLHKRTPKAIKARLYYQGYDYNAVSGEFRKWTATEDKILLEKVATNSSDFLAQTFNCHSATVKHRLLKLGYAKMKADALRVHDIMKIIKMDFITVNTYVQKQKQKEKVQAERAQKEQKEPPVLSDSQKALEKIYMELNIIKQSLAK